MIARAVSSSGAICLGCRLRLLRQATGPYRQPLGQRLVLDRRTKQRWFGTGAAARASEPDTSRAKIDPLVAKDASEHEQTEAQDAELFLQPDEFAEEIEYEAVPPVREENFRSVKRLNFRKKHLSGSRVLTEATESLGSDMLGKPAYAIVMRDGGTFTRKKPSVEIEDAAGAPDKPERLDISSLLLHQTQPPTEDEVRDNINELRPKSEIYLAEKEFRKIQHELENSFLKAQLSNYLKTFKAENSAEILTATVVDEDETKSKSKAPVETYPTKPNELVVPKFEWITKISPWIPLGSNEVITEQTDRHLYGYVSPTAKAKDRLAVRIMRECWGLHMEELSVGLGEVRLTLREHEFILLLRGTRRFLNLLNELYLEPGESIAAIRSKHTIRIVAKRTTSQTIIEELDATLQKINTSTFPVSYVTPDPTKIDAALLEEVGRLTNTHVRFSKTGKRIHVTWLEVRKTDRFEVEDLRHVVVRFLLTALKPNTALRTLHVPDHSPGKAEGRYLVDHYNQEKWAWKDRMGKWARFTLPIATFDAKMLDKLPHTSQGNIPEDQKGAIDGPFQELKIPIEHSPLPPPSASELVRVVAMEELRDETSIEPMSSATATGPAFHEGSRFPYQPIRWSPDLTTMTTAVFGHVLHPYPRTNLTPASPKAKHPRIFSPVVPHPMYLAQLDPKLEKFSLCPITSTMLIRLRAYQTPANSLLAPSLELRLFLSDPDTTGQDPEITGIHSLRAITTTHIHDVLQPSHPVDFRITQTRSALLQGSLRDMESWQPINDFLSKARLDLSAGKLEMPPTQRFQIPRRLFTEPFKYKQPPPEKSYKRKDHKESTTEEAIPNFIDAKPDTLMSTNYEFTGLELHRSTSVPHPENHAFTLTYTSIEAGQSGGRRAELSLHPIPLWSSSSRGSDSDAPFGSAPLDVNSSSTSQDITNAIAGSDTSQESEEAFQQQGGDTGEILHDDYLRACYQFARTARLWAGRFADNKSTRL